MRRIAAVLAVAAVALGPLSPLPADAAPLRPRRAVLVSMPSITWEDVDRGLAPNLSTLQRRWSVAALSIRTVGSRTDQSSAMATIGAGNRARGNAARPIAQGDLASAPNAVVQADGTLKVRAMSHVRADNAELSFGAEPGRLGWRLHRAGLRTGVVGNSDGGVLFRTSNDRVGSGRDRRRFGALALADLSGRVDAGEVGDHLAVRDPATLNGYRTDPAALLTAFRSVSRQSDVTLVELADAHREGLIAYGDVPELETRPSHKAARDRAVRRDDALLGRVMSELDLRRDSLMVVSTAGVGPAEPEQLMIAGLAGAGAARSGWLTSPITLRKGLVTISDIGPGLLRLFELDLPTSMSGRPLRAVPGPDARLPRLLKFQQNAVFHGQWVGTFFGLFVVAQGLLYLISWRRLHGGRGPSLAWLNRSCLAFMAVPVSVMPLVVLTPQRWGPAWPVLVIAAISAMVVLAALTGPWRKHPQGPAVFVAALTFIVLAADLATGANLQLSSLVGYSPVVAGRFYGIGNLTFALLATSALLLAAQIGHRWGRRGWWAAAAVAGATILLDGHPGFGSDFGGVLSLFPAFGVLLLLLAGKRVSPAKALSLGLAALLTAFAFGLADSFRPVDQQTHIGRFVERLLDDGLAGVAGIILRKAQANLWVLSRSVLSLAIPIAVVFLAIMLRSPHGKLLVALRTLPALRHGLIAAAVANVVAFAVNDSGVAIPAMGLSLAAPFCLSVLLRLPDGQPGSG